MLELTDVIELPAGVVLRDGALVDEVVRTSWPMNTAGAFVVAREGRPLGEVAGDVAAAYDLPGEQARADVLAFAWQLNRLALANIGRRGGRLGHLTAWLLLALRLAPAGALPPLAVRRCTLDTTTAARAVAGVARGLLRRCLLLGVAAAVLVAHLGLIGGQPSLLLPAAAGGAVGISVALHEAGHAIALRGIPSALVLRSVRASVVHAPAGSRRRALVAMTGPGVVVASGIGLLSAAVLLGAPSLAAAGGPAALHAVALTVLASDGRTACGLLP